MPIPIPDDVKPDGNGKYPFPVSADGDRIVIGDILYGGDGVCWIVMNTKPGEKYDVVGADGNRVNEFLRGRWLSVRPPVLDHRFVPQTEEDIYKRYPKSDGESFKDWLYKYFFPKPQYPDLTPVDFGCPVADGPKPTDDVVNRICYTQNGFYFNSSHTDNGLAKSKNWKYRYGQYVRKPYKQDWIIVEDKTIHKGSKLYRKDAPGVYYFDYVDASDTSEDPIVFIKRKHFGAGCKPFFESDSYERFNLLGVPKSTLSTKPFEDSTLCLNKQLDSILSEPNTSKLQDYIIDFINNDDSVLHFKANSILLMSPKKLYITVLEHMYRRKFRLEGIML